MKAVLAGLVLMGACWVGDDDDSAANSWAPTIESSFPASTTQELSIDGSLRFAAAGMDVDSLHLDYAWLVDGALEAGGSSEDGVFDTSWDLLWTAKRSGERIQVAFEVDDGDFVETLTWPVDVE